MQIFVGIGDFGFQLSTKISLHRLIRDAGCHDNRMIDKLTSSFTLTKIIKTPCCLWIPLARKTKFSLEAGHTAATFSSSKRTYLSLNLTLKSITGLSKVLLTSRTPFNT